MNGLHHLKRLEEACIMATLKAVAASLPKAAAMRRVKTWTVKESCGRPGKRGSC